MNQAQAKAAVPDEGSPEIKALERKTSDRIVAAADKLLGAELAGRIETNFDNREKLLERQFERMADLVTARESLGELTEKQPLMGAIFQAAAKAGHASKSLGGQAQFIEEALAKSVGPRVAKTINLGDASEGGNLQIQGTVLELWLDTLRAQSVVLGLNPEIVPEPGSTLKVTGFETDPTIHWVEEENTTELASTPATGERQTQMRKALMLLPVTADYRESASPAVLRRLEDLARSAFRIGFDLKYITGTGLSNTVKGMRNHISATGASAGQTVANVLADAEAAWNSIESNNIPVDRFAVIWAPRTKNHLMFLYDTVLGGRPIFMDEMRAGTFLGWPFGTTTNVPTNLSGTDSYIIWQAMNQFFIGQSTSLDMRWYENASYTDAGALVSTIERDTEVLRGRMKTATLMPHTTSGYVTTGVAYGT